MPDHRGYRAKSRHVFQKKRRGMPKPSQLTKVYKLGDYVQIKVDPAVHKGMAHRIYQGKTGVVWNITRNAVGVLLRKKCKDRYRSKRLHVRIEHIIPSGCQKEFKTRCSFNRKYARNHKKDPKKFPRKPLKRSPKQPDRASLVKLSDTVVKDLKIPVHVDVVKL